MEFLSPPSIAVFEITPHAIGILALVLIARVVFSLD